MNSKNFLLLLKFLTVIALVAISEARQSEAKEKLVLLSSLNLQKALEKHALSERLSLWFDYVSYPKRLEGLFRENFQGMDYDLVILHYANQHDLRSHLVDADTAAVFWFSHGSFHGHESAGIVKGGLLDWQSFDVTPVLANPHPNLRVLGLISCHSQQIVADLVPSILPNDQDNRRLIVTYRSPISATAVDKDLFATSKEHLEKTGESSKIASSNAREHRIEIKRLCPFGSSRFPAIRIETSTQAIVTTFPPCQPGETQMGSGYISNIGPLSKLIVNAGWNPQLRHRDDMEGLHLGKFDFTFALRHEPGSWQIFANQNGEAFGFTQNVYQFKEADKQLFERGPSSD